MVPFPALEDTFEDVFFWYGLSEWMLSTLNVRLFLIGLKPELTTDTGALDSASKPMVLTSEALLLVPLRWWFLDFWRRLLLLLLTLGFLNVLLSTFTGLWSGNELGLVLELTFFLATAGGGGLFDGSYGDFP